MLGPGVAGEDPAWRLLCVAEHGKSDRRHGVRSTEHLDAPATQVEPVAHLEGAQLQHRMLGGWESP